MITTTFRIIFNQPIFQRLLQTRTGTPKSSKEAPLGIDGTRSFTDWMPFLSPNQQCQSTEGMQNTSTIAGHILQL